MNERKGCTGKEVCETIVKAIKLDNPDYPYTAKEIWESSSTGELARVFFAYEWAKTRLLTRTAGRNQNDKC